VEHVRITQGRATHIAKDCPASEQAPWVNALSADAVSAMPHLAGSSAPDDIA